MHLPTSTFHTNPPCTQSRIYISSCPSLVSHEAECFSMNKTLTILILAAAGRAVAADTAAAGDWGLAGSLAVTSDYRFRGISQNDGHFAPQGSLNLTGPDGWYAGTWGSQLDFDDHAGTSVEWDIYG